LLHPGRPGTLITQLGKLSLRSDSVNPTLRCPDVRVGSWRSIPRASFWRKCPARGCAPAPPAARVITAEPTQPKSRMVACLRKHHATALVRPYRT
jgi:hypothetical protein